MLLLKETMTNLILIVYSYQNWGPDSSTTQESLLLQAAACSLGDLINLFILLSNLSSILIKKAWQNIFG